VLLSFAQFGREVFGERVHDKIAASKRKGVRAGGPVPLGCCIDKRHFVVRSRRADSWTKRNQLPARAGSHINFCTTLARYVAPSFRDLDFSRSR
jgi:hypothetical protein